MNNLKPLFIIYIVLIFGLASSVNAQELKCDITINNDLVEESSLTYITELANRLEDYINEHKWTDLDFMEEERIKCQMQIVIESGNSNYDFRSRVVFSIRRPIYNTTTETTSIIITDNSWNFNYPEGRSLIHDELQFDELTSFVNYLVYMGLGYDFDSFSPLGGTEYFRKAQNIVDLAQAASSPSWLRSSNNRRNRNTLVGDLLSSSYQDFRNAFYTYHLKGLDLFTTDDKQARTNIINALEEIRDAKRKTTSNFLFDIFFDTKSREIAGIFAEAESRVKLEAYSILSETDQSHLSEYSDLQN